MQKRIKGLPLYEAKLGNTDCGVLRVSLVDAPAVESDFQSYAEQKPIQLYTIEDEEARRVFGVVLRADYPIYRNDDGREYFILFRSEQIRAFAQKYLAEGRANEVDLNHDFVSIEGAEMVQFFIKDSSKGVAPEGYEDIADGSLFAEYQITDESLWERIKTGEFKGFSVEIIHDIVPVQDNFVKHQNMTLLERMKAALAKCVEAIDEVSNYGRVATDKGTLVWAEDDDLAAGMAVWAEDEQGNRVEVADGEYATEESAVIVVEGGKVKEIKDITPEEPATPEEPSEEAMEEKASEEPATETPEEPAEDAEARIAELEGLLAERDSRIADLEQTIADLEQKLAEPAAEPAHDAYKKKVSSANFFEEIAKLGK